MESSGRKRPEDLDLSDAAVSGRVNLGLCFSKEFDVCGLSNCTAAHF